MKIVFEPSYARMKRKDMPEVGGNGTHRKAAEFRRFLKPQRKLCGIGEECKKPAERKDKSYLAVQKQERVYRNLRTAIEGWNVRAALRALREGADLLKKDYHGFMPLELARSELERERKEGCAWNPAAAWIIRILEEGTERAFNTRKAEPWTLEEKKARWREIRRVGMSYSKYEIERAFGKMRQDGGFVLPQDEHLHLESYSAMVRREDEWARRRR